MIGSESANGTGDVDPALLDALERLRGTGPEFDGFLANHAPMAAEALSILGRSDQLPVWVDEYKPRLAEAPEVRRGIPSTEWRAHLGNAELAGDWRELIAREASELPWRELLARWWERLMPGMAASATHGVIRTAHAVRSLASAGEGLAAPEGLLVDELVQGLALWAARYQLLPGVPRPSGSLSATSATAALPRLAESVSSPGPGVMGRLAALGTLPGFPAAVDQWGPDPDPDAALDDLIRSAALVVAARDDAPVALCHTVTAPAAVRMVLPHLPIGMRGPSVATAWQAMAGIVAAFASPRLDAESALVGRDGAVLVDIEALVDRAAWHGDEHVIKLTEAAVREFARQRDPVLLLAAARFHARMPSSAERKK